MSDLQLDCPLCCDKSFDSKDALLEHLVDVTNNLFCPICNSKWSSLEGLTEHLTVYNCQSVQNESVQNIVIYEQSMDNIDNSTDLKDSDIKTLSPGKYGFFHKNPYIEKMILIYNIFYIILKKNRLIQEIQNTG